jgi:hypothetical protein
MRGHRSVVKLHLRGEVTGVEMEDFRAINTNMMEFRRNAVFVKYDSGQSFFPIYNEVDRKVYEAHVLFDVFCRNGLSLRPIYGVSACLTVWLRPKKNKERIDSGLN